jgi:hypothetical protein
MSKISTLGLFLTSLLALGCTASPVDAPDMVGGAADASAPNNAPDGAPGAIDAMQEAAVLPTWTLEDIQPLSPQFGQTYGLSSFPDKIVVALLVAGF